MTTKNTVATLDVRLAILEQKHEELLQFCAELLANQSGDAQHALCMFEKIHTRFTALEGRPATAPVAAKTAATGALALDKAERVRRIQILAAQNPKARSFTDAQILACA